ncbi:MAG: AAA family ATPase [Sphingomonas sp.]
MYDEHYGLSGRPFQLTPDPRFWFDTATHRKAMAYLGYGLAQGEGFIVVTGDIGAGKTTLVGHLMATIDSERLLAIKITSSQIEPDDLLRMVGAGLSVDTGGMSKSQLLAAIERGLLANARNGRRTLLIIDEAQALPVASLEELRMLSNIQAGGHALLQIFLLGQPEFRERLQGSSRLEQLRQRIIAMHHLDPMGPDEVEAYMRHRLTLVGWSGMPYFTTEAYAALHRGSEGVPRRLNQLAGRVMLFGAIEQLDRLDEEVVETVVAESQAELRQVTDVAERRESSEADTAPKRQSVDGAGRNGDVAAPVLQKYEGPEDQDDETVTSGEPIFAALPITGGFGGAADASGGATHQALSDPLGAAAAEHEWPVHDGGVATTPHAAGAVDVAPLIDRIAALEARIEDQETALRRVLTLLVDWVEGEQPDMAAFSRAAG